MTETTYAPGPCMKFIYDDGGRAAAGFAGGAGDCVCRSIAIASGRPYTEIYRALADGNASERITRCSGRARGRRTAREGIDTRRQWFRRLMESWGFRWTPTMGIGTGCRVHLTDGELPMGRLVVAVSKHMTAVIDGVIHDTHDPRRTTLFYEDNQVVRTAERCVYGYWEFRP